MSSGKGSTNYKDYKQVDKKIGGFRITGEYNKKIKYLDVAVSYSNPKLKKTISKGTKYISKLFK